MADSPTTKSTTTTKDAPAATETDAALLSSDSTHSTKKEATDVPETYPPSGPSVIEERGEPS
jgi:hypothetical protein